MININKETEECIVCHKQTNIPKDLDIDLREYYIEGAGQLCKECFVDINEKDCKSCENYNIIHIKIKDINKN